MRRCALHFAGLCLLVPAILVRPTLAGEMRWDDHQWQPANGQWQATGDEYVQSNPSLYGAWSLWTAERFTTVDISVRFRIEPTGSGVRAAGIVFRAVDKDHFFFAHFDSRNDQLLVTRWSAGQSKHLARIPSIGLKTDRWQTGRVHCVGLKARIYLDGQLLTEVDGVTENAGYTGLRAGQGIVRFRDWQVHGAAKAREAKADAPWWDAGWAWRIPVEIREPSHDDRRQALTSIRLNFAGRAHAFVPRPDGSFAATDVVVVDADNRPIPSWLTPIRTRESDDGALVDQAEICFPVDVAWCQSTEYFVYFGNPAARREQAETWRRDVESFASLDDGALPDQWRFPSGRWQSRAVTRPESRRSAVASVASDRHVAFPGITKTKRGTLLVVYREGYAHASGNPDDGRVMLVRSDDLGKTWSQPALVTDDPAMDDRNAAISTMQDGRVVVIFDKYLHGHHHFAWMTISDDDGRTWCDPFRVSKTEDVHTRSPVLDLANGKWLVPYSESTSTPTAATFFAILDPETRLFDEVAATPRGQRNVADEVTVTRAADGRLVALIRSNVDPELFQIESSDEGRTWSAARMNGIPSQFTPADLITLVDGRLLCSFSFRERRNERLVVSRDHGRTWDVENSVEVFDGTMAIGGDRSYPASVQLDEHSVGTVIYETRGPPTGGHIWFVRTPLSAFDAPKENTLYQADASVEAALAVWPDRPATAVDFTYRFTGLFGVAPNRIGLLMDCEDSNNYKGFLFQMGVEPRRNTPTNQVAWVECVDGQSKITQARPARGDWFNDGRIHRLGARRLDEGWTLTIDGIDQFSVPETSGRPRGIVVQRAAAAIYEVSRSSQPLQHDTRPLDVRAFDPRPR